MKYCYEQQFLLSRQVFDFFYAGKHPRKAQERIQELIAAGLLKRDRAITLGRASIIRLTEAGRKVARELAPFDVPQTKKLDTATLEHDAIITDVRHRIAQLWDGLWMPERALKDKYRQIPDGLFQFEPSGKIVALEVENSLKGRTRFVNLLHGWQRETGVALVLYIATHDRVFSAIKDYLAGAPSRPAFALVHWASLRGGAPKAYSVAGELDLFSRRAF